LRRLYQHRREILCGDRSYTHTHCDSNGHTYGDTNADRNTNAVHREMRTNAKAAPDASA